jgi:putative transcriptional regulator
VTQPTACLDEGQLLDAALGLLDGDAARHLATCPRCAADARLLGEGLSGAASSTVAPIAPPPSLRARLLASVASEAGLPYGEHQAALERLFDLDAAGVRALLARARDAAEWEPGFVPGMWLFHLEPGPRWRAAADSGRRLDAGLVRFEPGARFDRHAHPGEEHTVILSGSLILDDGRLYRPGETSLERDGSEHGFFAGPDGCTFAVVLIDGLKFVEKK